MKQAELGLNLTTKRTRKREFLAEMERVVPWAALVALIAPYAPEGRRGRPPFGVQTMLGKLGSDHNFHSPAGDCPPHARAAGRAVGGGVQGRLLAPHLPEQRREDA